MSEKEYLEQCIAKCMKKLGGRRSIAVKEAQKHVDWWRSKIFIFHNLSCFTEMIDSACDGSKSDRCSWARKNIIRKTEKWILNNGG